MPVKVSEKCRVIVEICVISVVLLPFVAMYLINTTKNDKATHKLSDKHFGEDFQDPNSIVNAIYGTLTVTGAMALDVFLDFFECNQKQWVDDRAERLLIVLIVAIPSIFMLNNLSPYFFACWHTFQVTACLFPVLLLCRKLVPLHFTRIKLLFMYTLFALSGVVSVAGYGKPFGSPENIFVLMSVSLSLLITLKTLLGWFLDISDRRMIYDSNESQRLSFRNVLTHDEVWCIVYLSCTFFTLSAVPFITAGLRSFLWENWGLLDISVNIYSLTAFVVLMNCIPSRARRRTARILTEKKMKLNHTTVRYISHEIRSPLNVVQNGVKFVKESLQHQCNEDIADTLADIEHASSAATSIVDDLLNFEKIESGNFQICTKLEPASICLSQMARRCRALAQNKQIAFSVIDQISASDNDAMSVFAINIDAIKMDQVIRNLVVNAIKFTPSGGSISVVLRHEAEPFFSIQSRPSSLDEKHHPWHVFWKFVKWLFFPHSNTFKVCCSNVDEAKLADDKMGGFIAENAGFITIEVTDTGVGITAEQCKKLFGEFVQFDPEKLQGGGGSGLGLWICREIINKHNGAIDVYSNGEGSGTTFSIQIKCFLVGKDKLGLHSQNSQNTDKQFECGSLQDPQQCQISLDLDERKSDYLLYASKASVDSANNLNLLHVLVVDDCSLNRKLLKKLLIKISKQVSASSSNASFSVLTVEADDGLTALEHIRSHQQPFDVVLLDNIMNSMNGPETAKEMRHLGFNGLIVGVTGNVTENDIADFISHGADEVLKKPVSHSLLETVVLRMSKTITKSAVPVSTIF